MADVALRARSVEVAAAAHERMQGARGALERALREGRQVYGLTTGLGPRVVEPIAPEQAGEQAARIVRGRATAVGEPLSDELTPGDAPRPLNGICAGGAGASPAVAETLPPC